MRYLLLLLLLTACGGDNLGPSAGPKLGRYAYSFSAQGLSASGTMVLTYSAPDSIAGHFEVSGYESGNFQLGFKNTDSYVVYVHPTQGGIAQHRLTPDATTGLRCAWGQYFVATSGSTADLRPAVCSTTYQGP